MSTIPPVAVDPGPSVPPRVRTVAYLVSLGVGAASMLVTMITAAVAPDAAVTVLAVCGAVTATTSFVVGGLGAAFRPTAGMPSTKPPKIDGKTWGDGTPVEGTPVVGDAPTAG